MAYAIETRAAGARQAARRYYGALNAVGGLNGYGRYISTSTQRGCGCPVVTDPIYRGPCPPNPNGTDLEDVYASFYQEGVLTADDSSPVAVTGAGVEFKRLELNTTNLISEEGIVKEKTRILIYDPGIYAVHYDFNVPQEQTVNTVLALLYDREIVPGSTLSVVKDSTDMSLHASAHALIEVDGEGAELILGSTGSLSLTPDAYASVCTLSIFSIA